MFYFIKGLAVFRIVAEPCADRFLLLGGLTVALHRALDVGGGWDTLFSVISSSSRLTWRVYSFWPSAMISSVCPSSYVSEASGARLRPSSFRPQFSPLSLQMSWSHRYDTKVTPQNVWKLTVYSLPSLSLYWPCPSIYSAISLGSEEISYIPAGCYSFVHLDK